MRRARVFAAGALLVIIGWGQAVGQDAPREIRPFVRLGYEANVEIYRDPVARWDPIDERWNLQDLGVFVGTTTEKVTIFGSGTVVTADGLILTNYHVFNAVQERAQRLKMLQEGKELRVSTPKGDEMLVFELSSQDPFAPPVEKYRARGIAWHPDLDVALLKISALADGKPLPKGPLPFVPLGNPYAIEPLALLQVLGYPARAGETMTPTAVQFSGYTKDAASAIDGSLKTVATISGGNSGGSALYKSRLVGIPTRVSVQGDDRGAKFAYFHPVTWAARPFAAAALQRGQRPPELDLRWVDDSHNTDVTRGHILLGGRAVSAATLRPIPGAFVIVQRADRTLTVEQMNPMLARAAQTRGKPAAALAGEPIPDDKGAFAFAFYKVPSGSDSDGFFLVSAPRKTKLKVLVEANGFRSNTVDHTSGETLFGDVGQVKLVQPLTPADLPGVRPSRSTQPAN